MIDLLRSSWSFPPSHTQTHILTHHTHTHTHTQKEQLNVPGPGEYNPQVPFFFLKIEYTGNTKKKTTFCVTQLPRAFIHTHTHTHTPCIIQLPRAFIDDGVSFPRQAARQEVRPLCVCVCLCVFVCVCVCTYKCWCICIFYHLRVRAVVRFS